MINVCSWMSRRYHVILRTTCLLWRVWRLWTGERQPRLIRIRLWSIWKVHRAGICRSSRIVKRWTWGIWTRCVEQRNWGIWARSRCGIWRPDRCRPPSISSRIRRITVFVPPATRASERRQRGARTVCTAATTESNPTIAARP